MSMIGHRVRDTREGQQSKNPNKIGKKVEVEIERKALTRQDWDKIKKTREGEREKSLPKREREREKKWIKKRDVRVWTARTLLVGRQRKKESSHVAAYHDCKSSSGI